uniref:Timeless C-terminal domain-containing protein n=1 Tax=Daphnia galeata TaxID=27404 RepID=A0A8J2S1H7_9CRUS|nr:unnamed protein product [Daphnia galeata]
MEHLKDVLTIDLLCYLTWEAVHQTEKLEMCALQPYSAAVDLKANARRLHLCVKAIREYLKTLERLSRRPNLNNSGFTQIGCENSIIQLDGYVPAIRDLRQLFLLQLRQFNPIVQCRSYLVDVISANHILLLTLERISSHQQQPSFDFNQHLTQFCSKTILDRYGTALEDFKNNGPYVNDCILTLLYHVAGDLGGLDLLCKPAILRPFSEIWKQEFDMRDEWNDLIECVVQKSLRNFQKRIRFNLETSPNSRNRSQDSACYLMDLLPMEYSEEVNVESIDQNHITDIELLVVQLKDSGFQKQLDWIQSSLLSACATRLGTFTGQEFRNPVTSLSFQMDLSCPVVPWTEMEASALRSELFVFLLFRIGLFPAQAVLYPRIPCEWSPDTLYSVALLFGPVEQERIDFNLTLVKKIELYFPNWEKQTPSCCCYAIREGVSFIEDSYLKCGEEIPRKIASIPHSPWLLDSLSTNSSLEVHKTDSSDDEDMVDGSRSSS